MRPGIWLPAYVYSEESDGESGSTHLHLKAQTRLWGYDLHNLGRTSNEEFTQILVDSQQPVKDQSGVAADPTPVLADRMWERQGEDNAVERLQKVGLLAPPGEVDKVLQTVVTNLLLTNKIDLQSDVHCRVLITAPLESFTVGHTIVLSRGLLDVLPDEASLAMVLAHELSHVVLGHQFDAMLAFSDRMFFPDEQSFQRLDFKRRPIDEEAADVKALELLKNSPYKEKLGGAGPSQPDPSSSRQQPGGGREHPHVRLAQLGAATRRASHRPDRRASPRREDQAGPVERPGRVSQRPARNPGSGPGENAI
jgi:hypothetical protein